MKIKVLLTGASGDIGREVLKELIRNDSNFDIRVLSLGSKKEKKYFQLCANKIQIIWGDIRDLETVNSAVNGVDVIIHLAAIIPPAAEHYPKIAEAVNVGGTKNIIAAILKQKTPPRLIYTSSVSVYGDRIQNPEIRVTDSLKPSMGDVYAVTKIQTEELIQKSKLEWTIFRLSAIMHPHRKIQPLMFHLPLDTPMEICNCTDTAFALVQAIKCDELWGNIYNLGGGENCRIRARDYLHAMFNIFGIDPHILPENAFATRHFHMGHYVDGHKLDHLLRFQRTGLKEHFEDVKKHTSFMKKRAIQMIPKQLIRKYLLSLSEPLQAIKKNNADLILRFYGSREEFELLGL